MSEHILPVTMTPKKGNPILTHWRIKQFTPAPDLERNSWRNLNYNGASTGNAFGKPEPLSYMFSVSLLRLDYKPGDTLRHDARDLAGYRINPGDTDNHALAYRGCELRQLWGTLSAWRQYEGTTRKHLDLRTMECGRELTKGQRDWLTEEVEAPVIAFVDAHRESLLAEAIEEIRGNMVGHMVRAQACLDRAKEAIPGILEAYAGPHPRDPRHH